MRLTLVPVALLALAQTVAPGVHGAPAVAFGQDNALADRRGLADDLTSVLSGLLDKLSGSGLPVQQIQDTIQQIAQQIVQALSPVVPLHPRVDLPLASSMTTSRASAAAATQAGPTTAGNASSVPASTAQTSTAPSNRMRRQGFPIPIPSGSFPEPAPERRNEQADD